MLTGRDSAMKLCLILISYIMPYESDRKCYFKVTEECLWYTDILSLQGSNRGAVTACEQSSIAECLIYIYDLYI